MIVIGIDPGARYTAISVRDGDELLLSSTYVRPKELPPITWAVTVTKQIMEDIIPLYPDAPIGIEGITDPNAYNQGVKSLNNPKHLIHLGFVVGALAGAFPKAVIVRPGKNGKKEWYPDALMGRRPKTLPGIATGAGTRNHERSAFDVAGAVESRIKDRYVLDKQQSLFDN
jgi:hypothetical protein